MWILLTLIFILLVSLFFINKTVIKSGRAKIYSLEELGQGYDAIIVPGCQVYEDMTPSPMLKDRLDGAISLYQNEVAEKIIVSGDSSAQKLDEPWVMRNYLVAAGIPAEKIFIDQDGIDTYDTVYRSQAIFGVKRGVLATQEFHLERALYIASRLDIDLKGYATDFYQYKQITRIKNSIRDFFARGKAWWETEFKVSPRSLGEVVDLSGSGFATLTAEQKENDPFFQHESN